MAWEEQIEIAALPLDVEKRRIVVSFVANLFRRTLKTTTGDETMKMSWIRFVGSWIACSTSENIVDAPRIEQNALLRTIVCSVDVCIYVYLYDPFDHLAVPIHSIRFDTIRFFAR